MHPYTPAWLALHAVPLSIAAVQLGVAVLALARRRWRLAGMLFAAAGIVGAGLGPSVVALASDAALPPSGLGPWATAAPFLAIAAVAAGRMRARAPVGIRSALGFLLAFDGLAALSMALTLAASGQLEAHAPRRRLLYAGIATLAASDAVNAGRFVLYDALAMGPPRDVLAVAGLEGGLAATAWVAVGAWMLDDARRELPSSAEIQRLSGLAHIAPEDLTIRPPPRGA